MGIEQDAYVIEKLEPLQFRTESEALRAVDQLNAGVGLINEIIVASLIGMVVDESTYERFWEVEATIYRMYPAAVLDSISP